MLLKYLQEKLPNKSKLGLYFNPFGEVRALINDCINAVVDDEIANKYSKDVVKCVGKAGSACLMHSSLLHGSAPNLSTKSRTLYIATYYAEDAIELSQNHLPSKLTHSIIKGRPSGKVRCSKYEMLIPEVPKGTSFFSQQAVSEENNN